MDNGYQAYLSWALANIIIFGELSCQQGVGHSYKALLEIIILEAIVLPVDNDILIVYDCL